MLLWLQWHISLSQLFVFRFQVSNLQLIIFVGFNVELRSSIGTGALIAQLIYQTDIFGFKFYFDSAYSLQIGLSLSKPDFKLSLASQNSLDFMLSMRTRKSSRFRLHPQSVILIVQVVNFAKEYIFLYVAAGVLTFECSDVLFQHFIFLIQFLAHSF